MLNYSIGMGLSQKILDQNKKEISVDELVEKYFPNPEDYFDESWQVFKKNDLEPNYSNVEDTISETGVRIEYLQNQDINKESEGNTSDNVKNVGQNSNSEEKLFDELKTNSIITLTENDDKPGGETSANECINNNPESKSLELGSHYTYEEYARDFAYIPQKQKGTGSTGKVTDTVEGDSQ